MVDDFTIKNGNQDTPNKGETKSRREKVVSVDTNHSVPVNGSQRIMRTVEMIFSDRVRCEIDNLVATVDTKVQKPF